MASTEWPTPRALGRQTAVAGGLVAVAGVLAVALGRPLVFPSLGPTAYVLATAPGAATSRPHRVVGGHAVGVLAGLAAWTVLGPPAAVTVPFRAGSDTALMLAGSATLATALTTVGMLATDLRHPPACATTLIVSLGLLTTPVEVAGILGAVVALVAVHAGGRAALR